MEALATAAAFLASMVLGWASLRLGPRLGLVDRPDAHLKPHEGRPIPLGGLGVLVGLHLGLGMAGAIDWGLLAATLLIWLIGLLDDRVGVDPMWRLAAAVLAGALVTLSQDPFPGWVASLAGITLVVLAVNAINLLDGMDALAASVGVVIALALAVLAGLRGLDHAFAAVVLAAALVGFLIWNLPPARLFLGDNGAYVVGVVLAWVALRSSAGWASGLVAAAVIGVPFLDLGATVVRRMRLRAPLFAGDRGHSYDKLHASGMSPLRVALVFSAAQAAWAGSVIAVSAALGDEAAVSFAVALGALVIGFLGWRRPRSTLPTSPPHG